MRFKTGLRAAIVLAAALWLAGCAGPIVASLTLGDIGTVASLVSVALTGKDWSDHALSLITGGDCNVTEGLMRKERDICEPRDSDQTALDFKGIFSAFDDNDPLARYARARQQELADAQLYDQTHGLTVPANTVVPDGLPQSGGDNRLVFIDGRIAYAMAPLGGPTDPPRRVVSDKLPEPGGDNRLVFVNGRIAYVMAPLGDARGPHRHVPHRHHEQGGGAAPMGTRTSRR